jgi:hypothetical protein
MNTDRPDQWPQVGASVIGASVRQWLVAKRKRRQQKMLIATCRQAQMCCLCGLVAWWLGVSIMIAAMVSHKSTENTEGRHRQQRMLIVAWRPAALSVLCVLCGSVRDTCSTVCCCAAVLLCCCAAAHLKPYTLNFEQRARTHPRASAFIPVSISATHDFLTC